MKKVSGYILGVLIVFNLFIDFTGAESKFDEMRRAELSFVEATLVVRKDQGERFQQLLMTNIRDSERDVRRRATYLANLYFSDNNKMLEKLISLLEPGKFKELSPQARINTMHLVTGTKENAWSRELANLVKERVKNIQDNPPQNWLNEQKKYFNEMRKRIDSLPAVSDTAWVFGIVQDRNEKTHSLTDIDVFVCNASASDETVVAKAKEVAKKLANYDFGRIRLRRWPVSEGSDMVAPSEKELRGIVKLHYFAGDSDGLLVKQVDKALSEINFNLPIQKMPSKESSELVNPWYFSLFICQ